VNRQPRGMLARLAKRFGTNKSFVSQVLNPKLPTSLPARHLPALLEVCKFTPDEKNRFLDLYSIAHGLDLNEVESSVDSRMFRMEIALPEFRDSEIRKLVVQSIKSNAETIISLAKKADRN